MNTQLTESSLLLAQPQNNVQCSQFGGRQDPSRYLSCGGQRPCSMIAGVLIEGVPGMFLRVFGAPHPSGYRAGARLFRMKVGGNARLPQERPHPVYEYCPVSCIGHPQKSAVARVSQKVTQIITPPNTNSDSAFSMTEVLSTRVWITGYKATT